MRRYQVGPLFLQQYETESLLTAQEQIGMALTLIMMAPRNLWKVLLSLETITSHSNSGSHSRCPLQKGIFIAVHSPLTHC